MPTPVYLKAYTDSTGTTTTVIPVQIPIPGTVNAPSPDTTTTVFPAGYIPAFTLSGTVPLGTGASTESTLAALNNKFSTTTVSGQPAINVAIVAGSGGGGGGGDASAANQVTGNNSLATIATNTAGLATASAQSTANASLASIATNTSGLTGLATATAQTTGNNFLSTIANSVPIAVESQVNITRPADTVAYAIADAISNSTTSPTILTFTGMARTSGGSGYITKARAMTNQSGNTQRLRLHLYNVAPTAVNDNAPQTVLYANRAGYVGTIDFTGLSTEGTGSDTAFSINNSPRLPFVTSGSASLFGMLETLDAFTPTSAQTFFIGLTAEQN